VSKSPELSKKKKKPQRPVGSDGKQSLRGGSPSVRSKTDASGLIFSYMLPALLDVGGGGGGGGEILGRVCVEDNVKEGLGWRNIWGWPSGRRAMGVECSCRPGGTKWGWD